MNRIACRRRRNCCGRRPTPRWDGRPPPEVVAMWREFRLWEGKHTCLRPPPWPGQTHDNSNPEDRERALQWYANLAAYEAARVQCAACRERPRLEAELIRALGLKLKPWQSGIDDFPDIVAALDAAV